MYGKKRHYDDEDSDRDRAKIRRPNKENIEKKIYNFGLEGFINIDVEMRELINHLISELQKSSTKLVKILVSCAKNIPERMSHYTCLIGMLNMKDYAFGEQFIGECVRELKEAIYINDFDSTKYLVRFIGDAINCRLVDPKSFFLMLENFVEITLESFSSNSCQGRCDWYTYLVLYCLPHCGKMLISYDPNLLESILNSIEHYIDRRSKTHVDILRVWNTNDPHPQEDYLEVLWAQVNDLREGNWVDSINQKLHYTLPSLLQHGRPHQFNPPAPSEYDSYTVYPLPRVIFRMFDYTDVIDYDEKNETNCRVLPGTHTIDRFFIDDHIQTILISCNYNRNICAKTLLGYETSAKVAIEYMIVEQIFGSMFQLPNSVVKHGKQLFYGSLIIQLCQESSMNMPLVLAQATEVLFDRMDQMKPVAIERFVNWFSYHLTNYQMQWTWEDWSFAIQEDRMSPRKRLIVETLVSLVRFSFYENVLQRIPAKFHKLLPPSPKYVNHFNKYKSTLAKEAFSKILNALRTRQDADEVYNLLEKTCSMFKEDSLNSISHERQRNNNEDKETNVNEKNVETSSSSSTDVEDNKSDQKPKIKEEPMDHLSSSVTVGGLCQRNEYETPHGIKRFETPISSLRQSPDPLPRTKFDDDDDVVNYEFSNSARQINKNNLIVIARRAIARPSTDQLDPQQKLRTPSIARNLSPPREITTDEEVEYIDDYDKNVIIVGTEQSSKTNYLYDGVQDSRIEVFMAALLFCGHKTISHTFSLIKRYSNVLKRLLITSSIDSQVDCLHIVKLAWSRQTQMCVMIVDHLCRTGFIDPEAVIRWAYSDQMCSLNLCKNKIYKKEEKQSDDNKNGGQKKAVGEEDAANRECYAHPPLLEFYIWDCINAVIHRIGQRVQKVSKNLENARESLTSNRLNTPSVSSSDSISASSDEDMLDCNEPEPLIDRLGKKNKIISSRDRSKTSVPPCNSSAVVARLTKERNFAVDIQANFLQNLLSYHSKLMLRVEQQMMMKKTMSTPVTGSLDLTINEDIKPPNVITFRGGDGDSCSSQRLRFIMFWLRGRLEQLLLDHYYQFRPHLDILNEFNTANGNNADNFQIVIHQWCSLFA